MKIIKGIAIIVSMVACMNLVGCSNPETPAGYEGYVVENPRLWGKGGFRGVVNGPGNYGASVWNNNVKNVDMRPNTYNEPFSIIASNGLKVNITWQSVIKPKSGSVQEVVEGYGGVDYYERFIQKPLRSRVRGKIQSIDAMEIKGKQGEIIKSVTADIEKYLADTPFILMEGVLGDIGFPVKVTDAIEEKLAADEKLKTKGTLVKAAIEDAKIRKEEALGIAAAQKIINATLTDQYLQHEAIEAQKIMAGSPNHTTVYIPVGANGLPLTKLAR